MRRAASRCCPAWSLTPPSRAGVTAASSASSPPERGHHLSRRHHRCCGRACEAPPAAIWLSTRRVGSSASRGGQPSQPLLAADVLSCSTASNASLPCGAPALMTAMSGPSHLARAAAVVLAQRMDESVTRQEQCAADVLYFMRAEEHARQGRRSAGGAPWSPAHRPALSETPLHDGDHHVHGPPSLSTSSWAELDRRLTAASASLSPGPPPPHLTNTPSSDHRCDSTEDDTHASSHASTTTTTTTISTAELFRRQQALFSLRRRLAYMLASGDASGDTQAGKTPPPMLRRVGRRTALALSLAHSVLHVGSASGGHGTTAAGRQAGAVATDSHGVYWESATAAVTGPAAAAAARGAADVRAATLNAAEPGRHDHCPYVYRSLAQPIELAPAEAHALLAWCAEQVSAYAAAVRDVSAAAAMSSDGGGGSSLGAAAQDGDSVSATRRPAAPPPPTGQRRQRGGVTSAAFCAGRDDGRDGEDSRADEAVYSAASLVEFVAALACSAAERGLPAVDGYAGPMGACAGRELPGVGESAPRGPLLLGRVVADAVATACDALHAVRDSGLLGVHVTALLSTCGDHAGPAAAASTDAPQPPPHQRQRQQQELEQRQAHLERLRRALSFEPATMRLVLCCMRESWSRALWLAERLATWNVTVAESLGVDGGLDAAAVPVAEPAPSSPASTCPRRRRSGLRCLGVDATHTLLYILAQHGRLAEVLRVSEDVCGVPASRLLDRASTVGADAALGLFTHMAAANTAATDTTTAATLLQCSSSSSSVGELAHAASASGAVALDRLRCVELVLLAGAVPQRVLSVTEYAVLLRRMIGGHTATRVTAAAAATSGVAWWCSPSQVWRRSAGLPHYVRTALCLVGFRVGVRHGSAAMLSLEDLYVVLTATRQLVQRRDGVVDRGGGGGGGTANVRPRRRWVSWGVEAEPPAVAELLHGAPPPPPPPLQPSSSARCISATCEEDGGATAATQRTRALLHSLVLAERRGAGPASVDHVKQLCDAFDILRCGVPPASSSTATPAAAHAGFGAGGNSAVLLSLVSQQMLAVLRAVRYTRNIGLFWHTALSALAALRLCEHADLAGVPDDRHRQRRGPTHGGSSVRLTSIHASAAGDEAADAVREDIAYALACEAEAVAAEQPAAAHRLVAPLPALAPHLSAYAVAALVQRPYRRTLTWQQCLALLPYTPLGSRAQVWLVRRIVQDTEGRRHVSAHTTAPPRGSPPSAALSTFSITALQTAGRMAAAQTAPRRPQRLLRGVAAELTGVAAGPACRLATATAAAGPDAEVASPASANAAARSDRALLALLLESHWWRALRAFTAAPARVQVGSAPHVVRLLVQADVWRDLDDAHRRPLVRLAVQSAATTSRGGASGLLEEVLHMTLEQGLWHTGLYFHQSVAAERPELVRQCQRAQRYAAQLCSGLLERTSMTTAVAQLTKAARRGQWAEASAAFLRYATGQHRDRDCSGVCGAGSTTAPPQRTAEDEAGATTAAAVASVEDGPRSTPRARSTLVPPTTTAELETLTARMNAGVPDRALDAGAAPARLSSSLGLIFGGGDGAAATLPPALGHVALMVRYAMLHTPSLWMHALRWLPTATLPLPFSHEEAWRAVCAGNSAKLHAITPPSPPPPPAHTPTLPRDDEDAIVAQLAVVAQQRYGGDATATVSLAETARRTHRPQHANEAMKERQAAVADALQVLRRAGAWEQAALLYETAVESRCMPYAASAVVLDTAQQGGAPWEVTLALFSRMSQRIRPDVSATAVALQACVVGGQWEAAFRVLRQAVLTQMTPVPRLVEMAVSTALHCGVWSRALAAAHRYRRTRDPQLAHTVLLTYVRTQHWDDAVAYFFDCTRRGLRPLDASLELALIASEAASDEYRKTAVMVGAIASALEDLYRMSGAVLEHIVFVQRHASRGGGGGGAADSPVSTAFTARGDVAAAVAVEGVTHDLTAPPAVLLQVPYVGVPPA
ncbi:hypothetical protein NESM_000086400 [Novymonas esmeraldas]|uniref:Uncharacterized protein n=1 Tax=Novymonas esmeraldas TaxID=1808958 RepID=A0AAW0F588_9TRYP